MNSRERIEQMKNKGIMTKDQPYDEYVKCLRTRYFRVYNEILPVDPDEIVKKLEEKKIL